MAGDWIKMRVNLWDDPRVSRLCDATGQTEAAVIGGLYWLWATADQHTEEGILHGLTLRAIDRKTGIDGFGDALVSIGWLEDHPEGVRIVNFDEHNGASAKRRSLDAQRKASVRKMSASKADASKTESGQNSPICGAREEKRREDISVPNGTDMGGASPPPPRPTRKCPPGFVVTDSMRAWAKEHTPMVDIDAATAAFRDHTFKTAMTDWQGAWRNWMRRDQRYAEERHRPAARKPPLAKEGFATIEYGESGLL